MRDDRSARTEQATPRRRREARCEGKVARSADLAAAGALLASIGIVAAAAGPVFEAWAIFSRRAMPQTAALEGGVGVSDVHGILLRSVLPILLLVWGTTALVCFAQIGPIFAPGLVRPRGERLNPIRGLARIFAGGSLVRASIDSSKLLFVAALVTALAVVGVEMVVTLPYRELPDAWSAVGAIVIRTGLLAGGTLLALGAVDFLYQRWRLGRELRMTREEIRDELREVEGDPEVRRRLRSRRRSGRRVDLATAVPESDLVVVNPEHVAVALRYEVGRMTAPRVVARGAGTLGRRIRELAEHAGVPVVERHGLARHLFRRVEVGAEIPRELHDAIARLMAQSLAGRKAVEA